MCLVVGAVVLDLVAAAAAAAAAASIAAPLPVDITCE